MCCTPPLGAFSFPHQHPGAAPLSSPPPAPNTTSSLRPAPNGSPAEPQTESTESFPSKLIATIKNILTSIWDGLCYGLHCLTCQRFAPPAAPPEESATPTPPSSGRGFSSAVVDDSDVSEESQSDSEENASVPNRISPTGDYRNFRYNLNLSTLVSYVMTPLQAPYGALYQNLYLEHVYDMSKPDLEKLLRANEAQRNSGSIEACNELLRAWMEIHIPQGATLSLQSKREVIEELVDMHHLLLPGVKATTDASRMERDSCIRAIITYKTKVGIKNNSLPTVKEITALNKELSKKTLFQLQKKCDAIKEATPEGAGCPQQ